MLTFSTGDPIATVYLLRMGVAWVAGRAGARAHT